MKLAIIAANGRTGRAFVEAALAAGHSLRAGARRGKIELQHPMLEIIACDATKLADVRRLIHDQDAVISLLGHVRGSGATVQTKATYILVEAMALENVQRVVSLTGTGVRFPMDKISLVDWFMNSSISLIDPKRIADGRRHAIVLQASTCDWTLLRVLKLTPGIAQPYRLTLHGEAKWFVSRATVAQAILEILGDDKTIQTAPIISRSSVK